MSIIKSDASKAISNFQFYLVKSDYKKILCYQCNPRHKLVEGIIKRDALHKQFISNLQFYFG